VAAVTTTRNNSKREEDHFMWIIFLNLFAEEHYMNNPKNPE